MELEKENKRLKVLIIILSIVLLCLGGFYYYMTFIRKNNSGSSNSSSSYDTNNSNMPEVNVDTTTTENNNNTEIYVESNVSNDSNPYIAIVNEKIDSQLEIIKNNTEESHDVTVYKNKRGNVYSAIIIDNQSPCSMNTYYLHNVTLGSGRPLTSAEVLEELNITHDSFVKSLRNNYLKFYEVDTAKYLDIVRKNNYDENASKERLNIAYNEILTTNFDENNYNIFINNDGKLETIIDNTIWQSKYPQVSMGECGSVHYFNAVLE